MPIIVLGASGLLGSTLCKLYEGKVTPIYREECDLTNEKQIKQLFYKYDPEIVINCAGDTTRTDTIRDDMYLVNSFAPHWLAQHANRLVHISTDCVFSGNIGYYDELNSPTGRGHYALSKRLGEVRSHPHLTIRTSFVGLPDPKSNGLLHWLTTKKKVNGYKNVLWNGLTTVELSHMIMKLIFSNKRGILHVFNSHTISKYDLLCLVKEVYGLDVEINPVDTPESNKTLETVYFDMQNVCEKTYRQLIEEMKNASI